MKSIRTTNESFHPLLKGTRVERTFFVFFSLSIFSVVLSICRAARYKLLACVRGCVLLSVLTDVQPLLVSS